jgi:hypothetical protein
MHGLCRSGYSIEPFAIELSSVQVAFLKITSLAKRLKEPDRLQAACSAGSAIRNLIPAAERSADTPADSGIRGAAFVRPISIL